MKAVYSGMHSTVRSLLNERSQQNDRILEANFGGQMEKATENSNCVNVYPILGVSFGSF